MLGMGRQKFRYAQRNPAEDCGTQNQCCQVGRRAPVSRPRWCSCRGSRGRVCCDAGLERKKVAVENGWMIKKCLLCARRYEEMRWLRGVGKIVQKRCGVGGCCSFVDEMHVEVDGKATTACKNLCRKEILPSSQFWEQVSTASLCVQALPYATTRSLLAGTEGVDGGRCEGDCMET